jgi:hypothetical protein
MLVRHSLFFSPSVVSFVAITQIVYPLESYAKKLLQIMWFTARKASPL